MGANATSITDLDGDALSGAIHAREVSCREVMQAYLERIHRLNPLCNAIVNLAPDEVLLRQADERDASSCVAETRDGPAPIDLGAVGASLLARDLFAPRDEARTCVAPCDAAPERRERGRGQRASCQRASSFASSPDCAISVTMSQPPTN